MRQIVIISLFLVFFSMFRLEGQNKPIKFSGDFFDVPFVDFAKEVKQQTGVPIYFREAWVKGIGVTVSGSNISLQRILERVLLPKGISYFIDEWGNVFLTNQMTVISRLPNYSGVIDLSEKLEETDREKTLTTAEQDYINGRKARIIETIRVGDGDESNGLSNAVIHGKMTDGETGEPLVGATIYIEELKKGAATDVDGRFSLVIRPGKYTIDLNCMGMESRQNYLEVLSDGILSISMKKRLVPITEVVIQANRFHNVRGTQMGFERLNYKVFKEIPLVMGERDVLK
ncbi:MAG: carboxypeptidase-like regulatory domain-containing protein, partial [Bacteroidales bacterium]|nr:carboxypeptidase-like regulatory domain-containing protein [Bacteroidales bacterium]